MELFKVIAKCGHVGKNRYAKKVFPVQAESGKLAASFVRSAPRVKHHHKDAILDVIRIEQDEYERLVIEHAMDPYFHCSNIQEQRRWVDESFYDEEREERSRREQSSKRVYDGKTLIRNPKKYARNTYFTERYA